MMVLAAETKKLFGRWEMLWNLVLRELKGRYKGSVLGFLWSILTPLFMAVIYIFFLRLLAGRGVPTEEIIIGVFAWQFTVQCVNSGMTSVSGSANLVKRVYFPRFVLPAAVTLAGLINFLLSLVVQFALVAILHFRRGGISAWSLAVPLVVIYQTGFNMALALLVSSANVYFRDTPHLVGIILSAWFFLSPVMYNLSFVQRMAGASGHLFDLYLLNPMAVIITAYRALILPEVQFPWTVYSVAGMIWPVFFLGAAWYVFQRSQRYFADIL